MAQGAGESDLANLARTGLARAYLGMGNWAAGGDLWEPGDPRLRVVDRLRRHQWRPESRCRGLSHGGNFTHGIHPWFTGVHPSFDGTGFVFTNDNIIAPQTDPRIQHDPTDRTGHNALTRLYKLVPGAPLQRVHGARPRRRPRRRAPPALGPLSSDMQLITGYATDILLADYTEAQHHYYEALAMQGTNTAAVLAFVNARRAVGNQAPVNLAGQALKTELRNQRARDLFMGGFRLADLRRWTRFDAGNGPFAGGSYFPTGTHPTTQWGSYGEWTCFPIPLSEYEGNPNLTKPLNPNVPPGI